MTEKEAIKELRLLKPKDQGYAFGGLSNASGLAVEIAIQALEKQIPKKIIFEDDGEVLLCPWCGIDLMGSLSDPDHDPYYCFECGQAIDWGKEEE